MSKRTMQRDQIELHQRGMKNTKQRNMVYHVLKQSESPLTADDIFSELQRQSCHISLSTVYRVLELFTDRGLIIKTTLLLQNKAVYEFINKDQTHYLICMHCHRNIPIEYCPVHEIEEDLVRKTQFKIIGHRLDIYGFCPECQKKMDKE